MTPLAHRGICGLCGRAFAFVLRSSCRLTSRSASGQGAVMTDADLEVFLLRVTLPPVRLGVYVKRLETRRTDAAVAESVRDELRRAERIRGRLARQGWWN
jgi:hypothetical protein